MRSLLCLRRSLYIAAIVCSALLSIPSYSLTFTTLVNFNFTNGGQPVAPLVQGKDGNFYGTTEGGGHNVGTVFKMTPTGTITPLYSFNFPGGVLPVGGLIQGVDGNFYGTTTGGGSNNGGTIFRISPAGVLSTLYNFNGTDGDEPTGTLAKANDGNFMA